jgi:hypothetical protein
MSVISFGPEFHDALVGAKRGASTQSSGNGGIGRPPPAPGIRSVANPAAIAPQIETPQYAVSENERYARMELAPDVLFEDAFKDIEYKKRTSASDSLLLIATLPLTGDRVFLKITAKPAHLALENSNLVEGAVYINLVDRLITQRITPHLLPAVGFLECAGMSSSLYSASFKTWSDRDKAFSAWRALLHQDGEAGEVIHDTACVLITQYDDSARPLGDVVPAHSIRNSEQFRSIMCQLLYTLEAFNQSDPPLRHNDLHMGNVFVDRVNGGSLTYVLSETEAYVVPSHDSFVRIFDFDYAFNGKHNTKHDSSPWDKGFCKTYGLCNEVNPSFDTYFIVSMLYRHGRRPYVRQLFPEQVGKSVVYNDPKPFGRKGWSLCHVPTEKDADRGKKKACDGEIHADELSQLQLPTTRELFATAAAPYRVPFHTVDLDAQDTFFITSELAQTIRASRSDRNARSAGSVTFIPKKPVHMQHMCAPDVAWPTDFLSGATEIKETVFRILIDWLCQVFAEEATEKGHGKQLSQVVSSFEHLAYYLAKNKATVTRAKLQLIGCVFCAYVWGGEVELDNWRDLSADTYSSDEFKTAYKDASVWMKPPPFCTVFDHLYVCGTPPPPGAAHKMTVMAVSPSMYSISPEERALFIRGQDSPIVARLYAEAEAELLAAQDFRTKFVNLNLEVPVSDALGFFAT